MAARTWRICVRASLPFQRVLAASLTPEPVPSWQHAGVDHFGNAVNWLFLDIAHRSFVVTAEARVDVRYPDPPPAAETPAWEDVAATAGARPGRRRSSCSTVRWCRRDMEARAYAAPSFAPRRPVLDALLELNNAHPCRFHLSAGADDDIDEDPRGAGAARRASARISPI